MKLVILASMLFLLNISIVIVDELNIYHFKPGESDNWRQDIEDIQTQKFDPDVAVDVATSFGFGDFISGFKNFVTALWRITLLGNNLKMFGLDPDGETSIVFLFNTLGIFIYILGIFQFISNRGLKGMQ